MKWKFTGPKFEIFITSHNDGRFYIVIGNEYFGGYSSAVAAADDVYTFTTGCDKWDRLEDTNYDPPTGLDEWERLA